MKNLPASEKLRMNHHIAFRVADVEATKEEIEGRGVEILMMNERLAGYTQLFVKDPGGYVIEFNSYGV